MDLSATIANAWSQHPGLVIALSVLALGLLVLLLAVVVMVMMWVSRRIASRRSAKNKTPKPKPVQRRARAKVRPWTSLQHWFRFHRKLSAALRIQVPNLQHYFVVGASASARQNFVDRHVGSRERVMATEQALYPGSSMSAHFERPSMPDAAGVELHIGKRGVVVEFDELHAGSQRGKARRALRWLCGWLYRIRYRHIRVMPVLVLDAATFPMQEAHAVNGWIEQTRGLLHDLRRACGRIGPVEVVLHGAEIFPGFEALSEAISPEGYGVGIPLRNMVGDEAELPKAVQEFASHLPRLLRNQPGDPEAPTGQESRGFTAALEFLRQAPDTWAHALARFVVRLHRRDPMIDVAMPGRLHLVAGHGTADLSPLGHEWEEGKAKPVKIAAPTAVALLDRGFVRAVLLILALAAAATGAAAGHRAWVDAQAEAMAVAVRDFKADPSNPQAMTHALAAVAQPGRLWTPEGTNRWRQLRQDFWQTRREHANAQLEHWSKRPYDKQRSLAMLAAFEQLQPRLEPYNDSDQGYQLETDQRARLNADFVAAIRNHALAPRLAGASHQEFLAVLTLMNAQAEPLRPLIGDRGPFFEAYLPSHLRGPYLERSRGAAGPGPAPSFQGAQQLDLPQFTALLSTALSDQRGLNRNQLSQLLQTRWDPQWLALCPQLVAALSDSEISLSELGVESCPDFSSSPYKRMFATLARSDIDWILAEVHSPTTMLRHLERLTKLRKDAQALENKKGIALNENAMNQVNNAKAKVAAEIAAKNYAPRRALVGEREFTETALWTAVLRSRLRTFSETCQKSESSSMFFELGEEQGYVGVEAEPPFSFARRVPAAYTKAAYTRRLVPILAQLGKEMAEAPDLPWQNFEDCVQRHHREYVASYGGHWRGFWNGWSVSVTSDREAMSWMQNLASHSGAWGAAWDLLAENFSFDVDRLVQSGTQAPTAGALGSGHRSTSELLAPMRDTLVRTMPAVRRVVRGTPEQRPIRQLGGILAPLIEALRVTQASPGQLSPADRAVRELIHESPGSAIAQMRTLLRSWHLSDRRDAARFLVGFNWLRQRGKQRLQARVDETWRSAVVPMLPGLVDAYPLRLDAPREITPSALTQLFSPGGQVEARLSKALAPLCTLNSVESKGALLLDLSCPGLRRPTGLVALVEALNTLRRNLWSGPGKAQPQMLRLRGKITKGRDLAYCEAWAETHPQCDRLNWRACRRDKLFACQQDGLSRAIFDLSGRRIIGLNHDSGLQRIPLKWGNTKDASLRFVWNDGRTVDIAERVAGDTAWTFFRLLEAGRSRKRGRATGFTWQARSRYGDQVEVEFTFQEDPRALFALFGDRLRRLAARYGS